jgi:hypothetical protein|tara:strand:- start:89 stop:391 length:303 start_codon:yes stop_codon:yes gene_type:complete
VDIFKPIHNFIGDKKMALVKKTEDDKIEIVGKFRNVQIRTATIVEEDGAEISRSYTRKVLMSDKNIDNENAEIKEICNTVWTPEIKKRLTDFYLKEKEKK